jgi:hypothetical protein
MGVLEEVSRISEREQILEHIAKIDYMLSAKDVPGILTVTEVCTALLEGQRILLEKLIKPSGV